MPSDDILDGDPPPVVRRAPFAENPAVGVRGQRTQQRIIEAALQAFGVAGYHGAAIADITDLAGCTRASFYQYFSGKDDVFRHLAGRVARQLFASAEALDVVDAGEHGWDALHAWVERHGDIYARYRPVFESFPAAADSDGVTASGSALVRARHIATLRSRLPRGAVPDNQVDDVIALLLVSMTRARHMSEVLCGLDEGSFTRARVDHGLTHLIHRTFFGVDVGFAREGWAGPRSRPTKVTALISGLHTAAGSDDPDPAAGSARDALLDAAQQTLVARGYFGTRIDDITDAAGLSHGAFYHYFEDKQQMARALASRALRRISQSFDGMPQLTSAGTPSGPALRAWLRRHTQSYASEAAVLRVWVDATAGDEALRDESAAALEWGRARVARFLEPRGYGDVDMDALSMVALLDALATRYRSDSAPIAAATIIERGLLGSAHR